MRRLILLAMVVILGGTLATGLPAWAIESWAGGVIELAAQVERATPQGRQVTVAVLDFADPAGATNEFGRLAAARLSLVLGQSLRLLPIERRSLNEYMKQLHVRRADLLDPAKARQFARDVGGLEVLVVTGLTDLGEQVSLDARVMDIAGNAPLGFASVVIPKDRKVRRLMEAGVETPADAR